MTFRLDIVTPEESIFSGEVENVYLPGAEGEIGVLPGHVALVTALQPGELRYRKDGKTEELAVGEGFVEVTKEQVTVLTDLAVGDSDINEASVEAAMRRAEDTLRQVEGSVNPDEVAALQASVAKSMAQLKLKRKRRQV